LLEAFSRLLGKGIDARLILVGWEQQLPEMLEKVSEDIREKICYEGFKTTDQLPEFYRKSDIFVLPSRYDGWGVVVNQALGAGLPVVCSDAVGSAEDLVEPGKNGFIFKSGEVDELEIVLTSLLTDDALIKGFSQESFARGQDITPEAGARDWVELLAEVLSARKRFFPS
jgi:glycosyltransferase involved in cell wall biosynthesis